MHDFFFRAKRVHLRSVACAKRIYREWELTPARLDILFIVSRAGHVLQRDLWKELGLHRSTVSKMLKRMRELDLVTTIPSVWNEHDREVRLTDLGILRTALCLKLAFVEGRVQEELVEAFTHVGEVREGPSEERSERIVLAPRVETEPVAASANDATALVTTALVTTALVTTGPEGGVAPQEEGEEPRSPAERFILATALRMDRAACGLGDTSWLQYPVPSPCPQLYAERFVVLAGMLLVSFIAKRKGRGMPMRTAYEQFAWAEEVLRNRMRLAEEERDRRWGPRARPHVRDAA